MKHAGASTRGFHRLALYATCPARFGFSEMLKLEPLRVSEPIARGSLGHIALMNHYLGQMGAAHTDPIGSMREAPERIAYAFEHMQHVVIRYLRYAEAADRGWEIVDVEREFRITFAGELYTQKADLVIRQRDDGRIYFVDHKFVQSARAVDKLPLWRTVDGQNLGYQLIGELTVGKVVYAGSEFGGVIINVISCQAPFEIKRHPVPITRSAVEGFRIAAAKTLKAAAGAEGQDVWTLEKRGLVSGACQGRYDACAYLRLCRDGKQALRDFDHRVDTVTDVRQSAGI